MNGSTAPARKPIYDPIDNTPEVLKSAGVSHGDWFRQLKKHWDLLLSDVTDEQRRFAFVLMRDALDFCELKHAHCQEEGVERPPDVRNALLCMEPKKEIDKNGKPKLGNDGKPKIVLGFEPTTLISAGLRAGFGKNTAQEQANRAARGLEGKGFLTRAGEGKRGKTRIWLHTDPAAQAAQRLKMVNETVYHAFSSPPPVPAEIAQRIIDLNQLPRKDIFPAVSHWRFPIDPALLSRPEYLGAARRRIEAFSEEVCLEQRRLKAQADRDLEELAEKYRGRINGEVNGGVHQRTNGEVNASVQQNAEMVNGSGGAIKEERNKEELRGRSLGDCDLLKEKSSSAFEKSRSLVHTEGQNHDDDYRFTAKPKTQNPPTGVEDQRCAPKKGAKPAPEKVGPTILVGLPDGAEIQVDVRAELHALATTIDPAMELLMKLHPERFTAAERDERELFPLPDPEITAQILQPWRGREIGFLDWLAYARERQLGRKRKGIGYALFLKDSVVCANQWAPDRLLSEKFKCASRLASRSQNRQAKEPEPRCERCKETGVVGSEFCSCEGGREKARRAQDYQEQTAKTARRINAMLSRPHTMSEHRHLICDHLSAEQPIPDCPCGLCSDAEVPVAAARASAAGG